MYCFGGGLFWVILNFWEIFFFEMIKNRLLFFFNIKETINLQKDDIDKIEEVRRNKYIQRDWNYRM